MGRAGRGAVSLGLAFAAVGGVGFLGWSLLGAGPSAEEVFFGRTLPSWWIATSKSELAKVDVFAELPAPGLRAPLERIAPLLATDPNGASAESIALNQAIEQAGLPYFVDVVVEGRWPLLLVFEVERRERYRQGELTQEVVVAERIDRTNVVTAFTGRKGDDLPIVLLDRIEASLLDLLQTAPKGPVRTLVRDRMLADAQTAVPGFRPEAAAEAVRAREKAMVQLERRRKLRLRRPRRFSLPEPWVDDIEDLLERARFARFELDPILDADARLRAEPVAAGLAHLRRQWADVSSAHQLHVGLSPDLTEAEPPEALRFVYGDSNTGFRQGGHLHMRAAIGAIRDTRAPACLALLRTLEGGAGPHRRATAYYYGTVSALLALFDTQEMDPAVLAERAARACDEGDEALRARAAVVAAEIGVPEVERLPSAPL